MHISFANRKLEKDCNDAKRLVRRHGKRRAQLLMNRLAVLSSATCLDDVGPPYQGPMRCHELTADRAGELSIDLDHPYRLIFKPDHDPLPLRAGGGLDWSQVTRITIVAIVDPH